MSLMFLFGKITGIIMLVAGIALNYIISRRKFNRRSITGVPKFKSFEYSWTRRLIEGLGKLIAIVLILAGFMLFLGSIMLPHRIK